MCDESAQAAPAQIDSKDYVLPFVAGAMKLYKIGMAFDSSKNRSSSVWGGKTCMPYIRENFA